MGNCDGTPSIHLDFGRHHSGRAGACGAHLSTSSRRKPVSSRSTTKCAGAPWGVGKAMTARKRPRPRKASEVRWKKLSRAFIKVQPGCCRTRPKGSHAPLLRRGPVETVVPTGTQGRVARAFGPLALQKRPTLTGTTDQSLPDRVGSNAGTQGSKTGGEASQGLSGIEVDWPESWRNQARPDLPQCWPGLGPAQTPALRRPCCWDWRQTGRSEALHAWRAGIPSRGTRVYRLTTAAGAGLLFLCLPWLALGVVNPHPAPSRRPPRSSSCGGDTSTCPDLDAGSVQRLVFWASGLEVHRPGPGIRCGPWHGLRPLPGVAA
jgi:hypothetical protein